MKLWILVLMVVMLSVVVIAELKIPTTEEDVAIRIELKPAFNYSALVIPNWNSSNFWDDLNVPTDISGSEYWINDSALCVAKLGDFMEGDLDYSFHNITNITAISIPVDSKTFSIDKKFYSEGSVPISLYYSSREFFGSFINFYLANTEFSVLGKYGMPYNFSFFEGKFNTSLWVANGVESTIFKGAWNGSSAYDDYNYNMTINQEYDYNFTDIDGLHYNMTIFVAGSYEYNETIIANAYCNAQGYVKNDSAVKFSWLEVDTSATLGREAITVDQDDENQPFFEFQGDASCRGSYYSPDSSDCNVLPAPSQMWGSILVEIDGSDYVIPIYATPTPEAPPE